MFGAELRCGLEGRHVGREKSWSRAVKQDGEVLPVNSEAYPVGGRGRLLSMVVMLDVGVR